MCGIAGIVARGGVEQADLSSMAAALSHRGPDGEGFVRSGAFHAAGETWQVGFAHRRLAVFDPTPAGAQPMRSRSGRTWIVLNGEIYNHHELRRHLSGFPFRTGTDTEVLLELIETLGIERALERTNGIFALAIWDDVERRLCLARDRLGVKPLFYAASASGVSFASELRALLARRGASCALDPRALSEYLDFGFVPAPRTIVQDVAKLPPGSLLVWSEGGHRIFEWWSLPAAAAARVEPGWREGLYARLCDSVRLQLRSDVPVGCFLSGGVDSTIVTALAVRECGPLDTFSVRFPEWPLLDEGEYARAVARSLGTRHHELPIAGQDVLEAAPALLDAIDEPFADSSLLAVSLLSRFARGVVTVALSGDGADELFAGYRRYQSARWLARWRRVPTPLRVYVAEPVLRRMAEDRGTRRGELVRRARKLLACAGLSSDAQALALARIFGAEQKRLLVPWMGEATEAGLHRMRDLRAVARGRDELDTRLRVDLLLGLPDDMLAKVDRGSMAHGLEVRVPFLDHRVVEYACALPSGLKLRGARSKVALREVFGAALPARVRRRAKAGFDAPIGAWLRGPLRGLVRDTLAPGALARGSWLSAEAVLQLVHDHESGRGDHAWQVWSLLVLQRWLERWADARAARREPSVAA
ncbi:MAG TPA: asparagine synthase (glutamine-hydrolyzing) [Deltaproteobacteria bacterium]|jgi:asparagine synthase (glutamine-hydrolysing)|nr:asparagine synthase (glutamine-hydrolyzing) [Deltaproteobacteria bacterium]